MNKREFQESTDPFDVDEGGDVETEDVETDEGDDTEELERPALQKLDILPVDEPLPPEVTAFLTDADRRIDEFFEQRKHVKKLGFFPSDYPLAYRILHAVRDLDQQPRSFCEWGSGFGVVTGLAAFLGYDACGIEIDPRLLRPSRKLIRDHRINAEILEGSFLPEEYLKTEKLSDKNTVTILSGSGVNDEVDDDIDDFDVIFAFPWPTEEELYFDLFARYAADGALLITYQAVESIHVFRKLPA